MSENARRLQYEMENPTVLKAVDLSLHRLPQKPDITMIFKTYLSYLSSTKSL